MWKQKESPSRIEKRFEFEEYQKISIFLKRIEELCKEKNIYPNISFGKNFVSISIFLDTKEIPSNEKNEIIYFLRNVENTLIKDLEIIKLKETQNLLVS